MTRRDLVRAGAGLFALNAGWGAAGKPLRGIFPIAQTPFAADGSLDLDVLVKQLEFIHRGGVHGFVWPQLASEWSTLTESERLAGAEALAGAGKKLKPAVVIGVQGADAASAERYAKHAAKIGADAVIALPPPGDKSEEAILAYYERIGRASDLPLFVQAVGMMSVEFVLKLWKTVPTLKLIKDEAGEPLMRVGRLRSESRDEIKVFTGGHGRTLIDEMARGTSGTMPAASFADLYASVWDQWQAGKRKEAMEMFGRTLLLVTEVQVYGVESLKYVLELRGVFRNHKGRTQAGLESRGRLDDAGRAVLREMVDYLRPWFRA